MKTITSEAAGVQDALEKRKDDVFHKWLKRARVRPHKHDGRLTCSEDQVEALLSDGESTETA